jgi:RNA polymerase sigma-70 factor (ECF subfamily)
MTSENPFPDLLRRIRAGDQEAAAELFRCHEPVLRRFIRTQMWHWQLRRTLDSIDVCQSVFGNFFQGVRLGRYDLQTPAELCQLLVVMARNKVISQMRRPHVWRQQERQPPDGANDACELLVSPEASPGWQTEARDLLRAIRDRLTDEERWLAEQHALGRTWARSPPNGTPAPRRCARSTIGPCSASPRNSAWSNDVRLASAGLNVVVRFAWVSC